MDIWGLIFTSIYYFFEISIYMTTLRWLYKLDKSDCECSNTYHKRYIQIWCLIYVVIVTTIYIYNIVNIVNISNEFHIENSSSMIQYSLTFFSIVNVIISIYYINELKKNKCTCSESLIRETYYIFNWIKLGLVCFFAFILLILTIGVTYQIVNNKNVSWTFNFQNSEIEISNSDKSSSTFSFKSISRKKPKILMSSSVPKTKNI